MKIDNNLKQFTTTSMNDKRLFWVSKYFRKYKVDEFPQFLNLIKGDINLVGPRPNIIELIDEYNYEEFFLLTIKPGITDISSIILFDLNKLVSKSNNPDYFYKKNIRPLKFKMGKFYIKNSSINIDFKIILSTFFSIINSRIGKNVLFFFLSIHQKNYLKSLIDNDKNNILRSS